MSAGFEYGPPPSETEVGTRDLLPTRYLTALCGLVGVEVSEVMGRGRTQRIVTVRHIAQAVAREELEYTLMEVGRFFDRDHASVINATTNVRHRLQYDGDSWFFNVFDAASSAYLNVFNLPFKNLKPKQ